MNGIRLIVCGLCATLVACTDNGGPNSDPFDRRRMLTAMADNVIVPAYATLHQRNVALRSAIDAFTATRDTATLNATRTAWTRAVEAWQSVVLFEFGPAEGLLGDLSENVYTFPASVSKIEQFIAVADTALQNFDRDARGYPALDYLLFRDDAMLTSAAFNASPMRCAYLRAVTRDISTKVEQVLSAWATSYRDDFVSRSGTDAGSGTSDAFNAMNRGYELLKNFKIGLPAGKQAGQTAPEPMKVEAPYSKISWHLANLHMKAVREVWTGRVIDTVRTLGFRDYILAMNGEQLERATMAQFDAVDQAASQIHINDDLGSLCAADDSRVAAYYTELQKLTRFIKSETSSLLGLSITYSSGDGD